MKRIRNMTAALAAVLTVAGLTLAVAPASARSRTPSRAGPGAGR
jgi:hypothetical protein